MIEKLDRHIKTEENGIRISCPPTQADCIEKINELVDVVNSLQTKAEILEENIHPTAKTDPYAEQRRWIGKLCRFWCSNKKYADLGVLQAITPANTPNKYLKKDSYNWYSNCEPVKPDDDIIFKGNK